MRLNPRCAKRSIANWPRPQRLTAKRVWTPHAGETLLLRAEHGNTVDRFAVAVMKGSNIVGHVVMDYTLESSGTSFRSVTAVSSVRLADLDVCLK